MSKILTISIAAYNVQDYIKETLDSLVKSKYIDELEIFVVDDGGQDATLDIAKEYEKKFPNSVHAIHKENGGYGTTVNWSVEHATGKYIRLLDGDDWFNTEGLDKLVEFLKQKEADLVLTELVRVMDGKILESKFRYGQYDQQIVDVDKLPRDFDFGMWSITLKTSIVKETFRPLPSKTLYTDMLFATYPMIKVNKVGFLSTVVYCYRQGREGQSISPESRVKHYQEYLRVVSIVKDYFYEHKVYEKPIFIQSRYLAKYKFTVFNLLLLPMSRENRRKLIELEEDTKRNARHFYDFCVGESKKIRLLRMTKYLAYYPLVKWVDNSF